MLCEGGALDEGFPAVLTHVGLLSCVDFFMYREVSWVPERFATRAASAHLAPLMNFCERNLLGAPAEEPTTTTFPGFVTFVALLMNFYM